MFKLVSAVKIDDTNSPSQFIASNVPEDDHNEWASGTTYTTGDKVMVTDAGVHKRYESLKDSNTDNYPPDTTKDDLTDPWWLELGATNRWAMFNTTVGDKTVSGETFSEATYAVDAVSGTAAGIAIQITPQQAVDYLALFGVKGVYADVIVKDTDGNTTYSKRKSLLAELSKADFYEYFFEPFVEIGDAVSFRDLATVSEGDIFLSIQKTDTENAKCGALAVGQQNDLGVATYGTSIGITDFSRKERDTFGNFKITERGFAKTMRADVFIPFNRISSVQSKLAAVRAQPTVFDASTEVSATLVFGFFTDFEITISTPANADATIDVEGLV